MIKSYTNKIGSTKLPRAEKGVKKYNGSVVTGGVQKQHMVSVFDGRGLG